MHGRSAAVDGNPRPRLSWPPTSTRRRNASGTNLRTALTAPAYPTAAPTAAGGSWFSEIQFNPWMPRVPARPLMLAQTLCGVPETPPRSNVMLEDGLESLAVPVTDSPVPTIRYRLT